MITLLTSRNESIYGIWDTVAGSNSSPSSVGVYQGQYNINEAPSESFDQNTTTKYLAFGVCYDASLLGPNCGLKTGFYITPSRGLSVLRTIRFATGYDYPERDPMTITIEISNQTTTTNLKLGSSWTLIYNGSTGLNTDPGRKTYGIRQYISTNTSCRSYRILVTSKRNNANSVQYSEVELMGN